MEKMELEELEELKAEARAALCLEDGEPAYWEHEDAHPCELCGAPADEPCRRGCVAWIN